MRIRTIQVLLFVLVLAVFAADFTTGCGKGYIYGRVTQKYNMGGNSETYMIAVNGQPYQVPLGFWQTVSLGDWVRYTGKDWYKAEPPTNPPTLQYPTVPAQKTP